MKQWFVATTKRNGESLAARELRKQEFVVYLPKTFEQHREGGRKEPVARLRLQGYIFISLDRTKDEHSPVNYTRGVGELLLDASGQPEPMRPHDIETLRAFEDEDFERAKAKLEVRDDLREWDEVIVDGADHHCFGEKGFFRSVSKGIAKVLIGKITWPVNMFDLKKVENPKKEAKPKKAKKKGRKA